MFQENCRTCHGDDRKGQPPAIPTLVDIGTRLDREQIGNIVKHGQGQMPAFPTLSADDLNALLAYLFNPTAAPASVPASTTEAKTDPANSTPETAHYKSGFGFMFTSSGLPAISPPWTSLTAYDLNQGTIKWKIPLGEVPELAARGIKDTGAHFPKVGPVVTAGGLIFAGTRDRKVRALDAETGKVLWEAQLDAALEGMPAVYEIGGREYLVVCAAAQATTHTHDLPGHPASQAPIPGAYVAFTLPDGETRNGAAQPPYQASR